MRKIYINVNESSYDSVINLLSQIPESEIEIIEKKPVFNAIAIKTSNFVFNRDEANAQIN